MPYDPTRHHHRTIRLRGYDYTQPGWYCVTICTHARRRLFDEPAQRRIAEEQWRALCYAGARGARGARVVIDAWAVMPNHIHGVIGITPRLRHPYPGHWPCPRARRGRRGRRMERRSRPIPRLGLRPVSTISLMISPSASVGAMIPMTAPLHPRRARTRPQLERVRRYIAANPARWAADRNHLDALLARMNLKD